MAKLTDTQLQDALVYMRGIGHALTDLPQEPDWGDGQHLNLPKVIPLAPDFEGEGPVAWLVANDFEGYDLTTTNPAKENN